MYHLQGCFEPGRLYRVPPFQHQNCDESTIFDLEKIHSLLKAPNLKYALHFAQIETTCQLIYLQNSEKAKVSDFNKQQEDDASNIYL